MEDEDARKRIQQGRDADRQAYVAPRDAAANEQRQLRGRQDRCNAMRDAISLKRNREAELNGKEVESLRSLETTCNNTCITR